MEKGPYPYCPHGTYVGGCGADYMCGACEMGDDPPTIWELELAIGYTYRNMASRFQQWAGIALTHAFESGSFANVLIEELMPKEMARIESFRGQIEEISRWATGPDDRGWLNRQYRAAIEEWEAMKGEEQFWSLPQEVLDGP